MKLSNHTPNHPSAMVYIAKIMEMEIMERKPKSKQESIEISACTLREKHHLGSLRTHVIYDSIVLMSAGCLRQIL